MVVVYEIYTGARVEALIVAIVEVDVAVLALPPITTLTLVVTLQVHATHGVDTRLTLTFVRIKLAGVSFPTESAVTGEPVDLIDTGTVVLAWARIALVDIISMALSTGK